MMIKDVHTEHCCLKHGCKYGDDDCTVTTKRAAQSFRCEYCYDDEQEFKNEAMGALEGNYLKELIEEYENKLEKLKKMVL